MSQADPVIRTYTSTSARDKGLGPSSAGQSGDLQGLSDSPEAGGESVVELVEEGQYFEAALVSGIENAPDPDVAEVRTTQVSEEDIPAEYRDETRPAVD